MRQISSFWATEKVNHIRCRQTYLQMAKEIENKGCIFGLIQLQIFTTTPFTGISMLSCKSIFTFYLSPNTFQKIFSENKLFSRYLVASPGMTTFIHVGSYFLSQISHRLMLYQLNQHLDIMFNIQNFHQTIIMFTNIVINL